MFKIGEKVAYKPQEPVTNPFCIVPQENETVTIQSFCTAPSGTPYVDIKEYLYARNGNLQAFPLSEFRKLDHTFAEEVTARIEEEINQENLIEA